MCLRDVAEKRNSYTMKEIAGDATKMLIDRSFHYKT